MDLLKNYSGLTGEELDVLSSESQEKLAIAFDDLRNSTEEAQANVCRLNTELENEKSSHSDHVSDLENELNTLKENAKSIQKMLDNAGTRSIDAHKERIELHDKVADLQSMNNELSYAIRNLENEKDLLNDQLKFKIEFTEELSNEIKTLKEECDSVRKLKMDTMFRLEEVSSREVAIKNQERRWDEESASMKRHIEWLEDRLRCTSDQLSTLRRDNTHKCQTLEYELELRKTESEHSLKTIEKLEENIRKLTQANEDYIEKLKQVADEQVRLETLYGNELDAQKQLVTLYKEQLTETESKNDELSTAAGSMQKLLKSAYETVTRLESEKTLLKEQFADEQNKLLQNVERLTEELSRSRDLLEKFRVDGLSEEEFRQLNPAVAATLSALKRGHSLTQLYTDYIQVVEDRDQLRLDKHRLTEYVSELVDEVKEKAPLLQEQQREFKQMKIELKDLKAQLNSTNETLEEAVSKRNEFQRRAGYYQRECGRLKVTCSDLSKQVQLLLREVEVNKGTIVEEPIQESPRSNPITSDPLSSSLSHRQLPDSSTMSVADANQLLIDLESSSADSVIDQHLVTWRGLQDLQRQNQRLLYVARDLAGQLEQRESNDSETTKQVNELTNRLESLSDELVVVRLAAREARTEATLAMRYRDLYRSQLERYDIPIQAADEEDSSGIADSNVTDNITNGKGEGDEEKLVNNGVSLANVSRLEETLGSLETEFKKYREDKIESDKIYTTTIDQLRKEGSESRLLNQKLAAQLDFTHEKLRTLEANVSGYKQEITVLREMNARYSTSAASSEAELSRLREEFIRTSDKLLEAEVDSRHSTRQLEVARANETRWRQEIDFLRQQQHSHTQLMHQLESIQGSLEHRDSRERSTMEKRIHLLQDQLTAAQSAFTESSQAAKATKETLEHEYGVLRQKLTAEEELSTQLKEQVSSLQQQVADLRPEEFDSDQYQSRIDSKRTRDSISLQTELQHQIESLQKRLESSRTQSDQMRQLAEDAERRLNELLQENYQLESRMKTDLEDSKQRCEFLEAQLDLEKEERQNLTNENIRLTEEAHQMNSELRRELSTLQSELDASKARCESALELEAGAKAEIESHGRIAQEARVKYERELALHAEDVEALTEARQQAEAARSNLVDLQCQLTATESRADSLAKDLDTMSSSWEAEKQELKASLLQMDKDQNLLQDQVVKLTQQIISLRKLMEKPDMIGQPFSNAKDSGSESTDETESTDLKTSEELLQLVNYLRRQKSIAETTCDASQAEVSRLLLRVSNLEQQKEHLQTELDNERKTGEFNAEQSRRHSELMERVEQLNLVTESNRLLRQEREALQTSLSNNEKQVQRLESVVGPLRLENSDLVAKLDLSTAEMRSLEEERDRWKERCSKLVETAQRMDPEQYRLACQERDELQRKVIRSDEELHHLTAKLTELRAETDERIREYNLQLTDARNLQQEAEQKSAEHSLTCVSLRRDLENRDTTIVKLREIGRKYRQETETLRRHVSMNRSGEAELQTTNEALTLTKADLVTAQADLSSLKSQFYQLSSAITEATQSILTLGSDDLIGPVLADVLSDTDSEISSDDRIDMRLLHLLSASLQSLKSEIGRLYQQADAQREKLLRMQLVESQLTKSLRDCSDLRVQLAELQNVPSSNMTITLPCSASQLRATTPSPITCSASESEPTDLSQSTLQCQRPASYPAPNTNAISSTESISDCALFSPNSHSTDPTVISCSQPIPGWILRAAAAVQPVQATPAFSSSASSTGSKQTAEIRPISSNIATVMPTPALQTPICAAPSADTAVIPPVTPVQSTSESSFSPQPQMMDQSRIEQPIGIRTTQPMRLSIFGQAVFADYTTAPQAGQTALGLWSTHLPGSSLVTNKRRLDESTPISSAEATIVADDAVASTSHPSDSTPASSGFSFLLSDAKRPRISIPTTCTTSIQSRTSAEPSTVVLERSAFGFPASIPPSAHATASRLIPIQEQPVPQESIPDAHEEHLTDVNSQSPSGEDAAGITEQRDSSETHVWNKIVSTSSAPKVSQSIAEHAVDSRGESSSTDRSGTYFFKQMAPQTHLSESFIRSPNEDLSARAELEMDDLSAKPQGFTVIRTEEPAECPELINVQEPIEGRTSELFEPGNENDVIEQCEVDVESESHPSDAESADNDDDEEEEIGMEGTDESAPEAEIDDEDDDHYTPYSADEEEEEEDAGVCDTSGFINEREEVIELSSASSKSHESDVDDDYVEGDLAEGDDEDAIDGDGGEIAVSNDEDEEGGQIAVSNDEDEEDQIDERDSRDESFEDRVDETFGPSSVSQTSVPIDDVEPQDETEAAEDEHLDTTITTATASCVAGTGIEPVDSAQHQSLFAMKTTHTETSGLGLFGGSFAHRPQVSSGLFSSSVPLPSDANVKLTTSSILPASTTAPSLFKSSVLGTQSINETPSTVSTKTSLFGPTSSKTSLDKPVSARTSKPKIQPIVWDQPESAPSSSSQLAPTEPPRIGAARRKKWGGPLPPSRSGPFAGPPGPGGHDAPGRTGPTSSMRPGPRRG